ncbi:transcriptional regulator [Streptomyces albospinus]|uniref:Transcriptional regulator n=1 Tax=Streptomyces albospinus TaxID=285515 RepID=A0ABQ2V7S1_9ACTN|nr:helix-turn-helix transcriptional regulator [Streptomyces albospinus]GGU71474.1 transcriptional regulator [Streptomyces albospinus]
MPAGGKPTVRSRRLGNALKRHREAAGLDQTDGADAIMKSVSKISRLESGQTSASALEVRTLLDRYGVEDADERSRLLEWARRSNERGWWIDYQEAVQPGYADHIALESEATCIRSWGPVLVPGLLQTPDYTEAVITIGPRLIAPKRAVELVKLRQERQRRIGEGGAHFTAIIWEPALTALNCEPGVWSGQLAHLLDVGERRNVTVQLLPLAANLTAGMSAPFVAFSFGVEANVEAVTLENPANTNVVEAPEDLAHYVKVFDQLRSAALSPDRSAEYIRRLLEVGTQHREEGP